MAFHTIKLKEIQEVARETTAFIFEKPEGFSFQAGQYVAMRLTHLVAEDDRRGVRSLSIASAPCEDFLMFAMRHTDSGFKQTMWSLKPGDTVEITDAVGAFVVPEDEQREVVFLIGGIGITPARSILRQAVEEGSTKRYALFYANRLPEDASFEEEIRGYALAGLRVMSLRSQCDGGDECQHCDEHGYISREVLEKYLDETSHKVYYLVGSPQFVAVMETMLLDIGVTKEQWHVDPFTGLTKTGESK